MENNPIYKTILERRSIRKFKNQIVEKEKIDILLKAAMAAPSACNLQPWTFIVVDDKQILNDIREVADQGKYNAPLMVVVCGTNKHIPWPGVGYMIDCGMAMQNIMLECSELGLGSVCVGGFDDKGLRKVLNIPEDIDPLCIIEIGYPNIYRKAYTWYTDEAVHYQKYDENKKRTMRTMEMLEDDIKSGLI